MASVLTILEKLLPFVASIRTSAPLTGCPAGSLTTPSKADVPPEALKAKRNKPTKQILYDLTNIPAFYGFLANKSRTFKSHCGTLRQQPLLLPTANSIRHVTQIPPAQFTPAFASISTAPCHQKIVLVCVTQDGD